MTRSRFCLWGLTLLAGALGLVGGGQLFGGGKAPSFDRLSAADRQAFEQRFEKEVWPLMQRGGKDGCVGCHTGKLVSSLHLSGNVHKDFTLLLKEGFFLPDDAGSLLGHLLERDPQRRMPPGKRPAWEQKDIQVLRAFVRDLDQKQQK